MTARSVQQVILLKNSLAAVKLPQSHHFVTVTAPIAHDIDATLRVNTYNCRGLSDNRISTIKELVSINDILFIQEDWLYEEQLHKLNIYDTHMSIAVSGMNSSIQI